MKLRGDLRMILGFYLQRLRQEKNNNQVVIRTLKIILEEGTSLEELIQEVQSRLPTLINSLGTREALEAYNLLGFCHQYGIGVKRDLGSAVNLYRYAAENGLPAARNNLGKCYEKGQGVEVDEKEAAEYYTQAANKGFAEAEYNLGLCYQNGIGVERNEQFAVSLYRRAAKQGLAYAQNLLGVCLEQGLLGFKIDEKEAVEFYQLAVEQGLAEAQYNLAQCYKEGVGLKVNVKIAAEFYREASSQGFSAAQNALGECYQQGVGVEIDEMQAVNLFQMAAAQGLADAEYNLAKCYEQGRGVERDERRASELYHRAAVRGLDIAQYKLGSCYLLGYGVVAKDIERAELLFMVSARTGHIQARRDLALLQYQQGGSVINLEKMVSYLMGVLRSKNDKIIGHAYSKLGFCHQMGLGTKQNLAQAALFYSQAIENGNIRSQWDLLLCYKQMHFINQEQISTFYETLKTPSLNNNMMRERSACLAYLYKYGGPYFEPNLFNAIELYQDIFERDMKKEAEYREFSQMKQAIYTPHQDLQKGLNNPRKRDNKDQSHEGHGKRARKKSLS